MAIPRRRYNGNLTAPGSDFDTKGVLPVDFFFLSRFPVFSSAFFEVSLFLFDCQFCGILPQFIRSVSVAKKRQLDALDDHRWELR